jgi:hypothetical protein
MALITIAPIGGLCNRMRALNSALTLGEQIGSRVELLWRRDSSLNCRFEELFSMPSGLARVIDVDLSRPGGRLFEKGVRFLRSRAGRFLYDQDFIAEAMRSGVDLHQEFRGKKVYVATVSAFFEAPDFHRFVPTVEVTGVVDSYRDKLHDAVGIHIRRTDSEPSIKHSPTEEFEKIMSGMLQDGYCHSFFLSTDSQEVESRLLDRFKDQVFIHSKRSCDRNVDQAIKDALVDLYCLADCKKIVGSYWSSFSGTAAQIGGKELIVVDVLSRG